MKASELRLGNLIKYRHNIFEVDILTDKGIGFDSGLTTEDDCEPIPLTEEWLLKFGFYKCSNRFDEWYQNNEMLWFKIFISSNGNKLLPYFFKQRISSATYVHQLQNLYFALTGEELKLKEDESK